MKLLLILDCALTLALSSLLVQPAPQAETASDEKPAAVDPPKPPDPPAAEPVPSAVETPKRDHPVHDFSKMTGRDEDTCSACHVPHVQTGSDDAGNQGVGDLFKIGRQRPEAATGRYTPGATSLICLTCHNGSVAVSTVGTAHAMRDGSGGASSPSFATRDHPVGVPYPDRRKGFRPRTSVEAAGKVKLPLGRVECISCHDQHEEQGLPHLLVMPNRRSALCIECHEK